MIKGVLRGNHRLEDKEELLSDDLLNLISILFQ